MQFYELFPERSSRTLLLTSYSNILEVILWLELYMGVGSTSHLWMLAIRFGEELLIRRLLREVAHAVNSTSTLTLKQGQEKRYIAYTMSIWGQLWIKSPHKSASLFSPGLWVSCWAINSWPLPSSVFFILLTPKWALPNSENNYSSIFSVHIHSCLFQVQK